MADTLLLVDDDVSKLRAIGEHFERIGYEVRRENTGEQAVETFQRVRPGVVLLDLGLPDSSGLVVLEHLRREGAAVILLTDQGDIASAVRAMQLGAENVLTKPVDLTHLAAAIARVVEKVRLTRENARLRAQIERHHAQSLSEVERQHIERTLRHHGGNRTRAAIELGISRATLINKIKVYSLNI
jgi:DNA-binding NtrC family response regulator